MMAGAPVPERRHLLSRERGERAAVVLLLIVYFLILFASGIKLHETFILPSEYRDLNSKALARIQEDYAEFERGFISPDKSTHGYSIVAWGDNHSSRRTLGQLVDKINRQNAENTAEWNRLKGRLAALKADTAMPGEARDRAIAELEAKIDEVHKMHLLFAINAGDLAYDGDVTKYRLTLQVADRLEIPMVTAIGNHDIRGNGRAAYREVWGPFSYSFAVGDAYYIVLDDADEKRVDPAQMKWLESELEKSKQYSYCLVDMHVPPFKGKRKQNEPMDKFLSDRENAQQIRDLVARYHVTFVLAGHIHTYDADTWEIPEDASTEGMTPLRAGDTDTDFIISGGAGARLWKVDSDANPAMSRARFHYFEIVMNAKQTELLDDGQEVTVFTTAFRRQEINPSLADAWYTLEEVWVCTYAKIGNLYAWEMLVLVPTLAVLIVFLLVLIRRRGGSAPGSSPATGLDATGPGPGPDPEPLEN